MIVSKAPPFKRGWGKSKIPPDLWEGGGGRWNLEAGSIGDGKSTRGERREGGNWDSQGGGVWDRETGIIEGEDQSTYRPPP